MTLRIVPPDTEELWKRVVAANEAFIAETTQQTGDAVIKAFDLFFDAFCDDPRVAARVKAKLRDRIRFVLEWAA